MFEDILGTITAETMLIAGAFILFSVLMIYFYRFSNKKLMKKIADLKKGEHELRDSIEKVNNARAKENKELKGRLDVIEEKLSIVVKAEGLEKKVEMEKIRAQMKK